MVWAGGAVARACEEIARRVASIGAALLQTEIGAVEVKDGGVCGPDGNISIGDIAKSYYLTPADLPGDTDSRGLETTEGYAPDCLTGIHTGSAHATVVAVDPETGGVEILGYVIAEDAGMDTRETIGAVEVKDGGVCGPDGNISIGDIAKSYYLTPADLPGDTDSRGLETTEGYAPDCLTGIHTGSAHATVVAVDPETGGVEILDYVIAEDAGTLVNPMIVDGQLYGGAAQGIGTALFEEMLYDSQGQPLASTLADYLLPGATDVPNIHLLHMETPSPYTNFGQKGVGEGGAIGPAAAIANAINDALAPLGVEICQIPVTPRRIIEALEEQRR